MSAPLLCPRCGCPVRPPGLWSDAWTCAAHGEVSPLHPAALPAPDLVEQTAARSRVPLWVPWPLPAGWLVTGMRWAGDEHAGPVATVLACSGPNPLPVAAEPDEGVELSRVADLLLVAEQPGTGLGAHLAGLDGVDPGSAVAGAPHLKLHVDGHDTALWCLTVDGAAAYVGEASGDWLWVLVWPHPAAAVLLEQFELRDLRDRSQVIDLPLGALTPRLVTAPAPDGAG